ncbi:MAG: 30S ribosomal protein S12 methylthiotransferase RimO [Deltaproteobacteria bacterium]|nr:30S ribosomal protein S12 methylthiotransferase RimO [Deltaproteobacteria bacterium]
MGRGQASPDGKPKTLEVSPLEATAPKDGAEGSFADAGQDSAEQDSGEQDGGEQIQSALIAARKVHLVSLGCSKNLVDSERLLAAASCLGFEPTLDPEAADLLVVNTCAFIKSAAQEAVATILQLAADKKPGARLVVAGCLASRYGDELKNELVEADLIIAPKDYDGFIRRLSAWYGEEAPNRVVLPFERWSRNLGTPKWRAWLKAAEGCDNRCTYCLIPSLRGRLAVRALDELVQEAEYLASLGVLELTLVAQDLTAWHGPGQTLVDLVEALSKIPSLVWLRLMYAYPGRLNERLVKDLASIPKVAPYLDVPIQHASESVLRRMGRRSCDHLRLAKNLKAWWPNLALRTTLMVGFPGETEQDFDQLVRLVEEGTFDHVGVFKYSPEEGTAAAKMSGQLSAAVKEKRRRRLMARQRKVSLALNRARVGQEKLFLVEGPSPDSPLVMIGRADFQAPEVDGVVYFDGLQPVAGQMVKGRLIKAGPYDLLAAIEPEVDGAE